ncbi:MAG: DMT family transporter [Alphaproteobacteria bacterium]|nr:DMT family transporter [Alphaproteobacteria bacterium]
MKLKDNLLAAVGFALFNALMLSAMSLFAKLLREYFGAFEVTFFRNVFSLIALLILLVLTRKLDILKTDRPRAHLLRSFIGTVGIVLGAQALGMMPLAETTILLFTSPLFVVLLSWPLLGERVGVYRMSAVLVGFLGVVIMANPGQGTEPLPLAGILIGLGWGLSAGLVDICLRWIGRTESSTTTTFYFVLFGTIACGMHWPFAEVKEGSFSLYTAFVIAGLGATGLLSLLAKSQSFRLGEAANVAPVMYTMIIWAMVFDYLVWDKAPSANVFIGAAIIIGSNLFILYREIKIKNRLNKKSDKSLELATREN